MARWPPRSHFCCSRFSRASRSCWVRSSTPPSKRSGRPRARTPTGCDGGWSNAPRKSSKTPVRQRTTTRRPCTPTESALLERLVDPLAVRTDRRARLSRLRHREHLAAERHNVRAHHGALRDLFLLDVVEVLGGVAVSPVVDAFVGVGALDRLGLHGTYCAGTGPATVSKVVQQWRNEAQPRAGFRRRWSTDPHHRRRTLLRSPTPCTRAEIFDDHVVPDSGAASCRRRVRHVAQRSSVTGDRCRVDPAAVDRGADRQRPSTTPRRRTASI